MAKRLTIEAFTPAGYNKGLVRVIAQTNRGTAFGENGSNSFTASNGIVLVSSKYPARDKDRTIPNANKFYVRGNDYAKDNNTFDVSETKLPKLKKAVEEYNAYFSDAAIYARNLAAARAAEAARQARLAADRAAQARVAAQPQVRIVGYTQIVG